MTKNRSNCEVKLKSGGDIEGLMEKVILTRGELQHRPSGLIEPGDLLESTQAAVAPACVPD